MKEGYVIHLHMRESFFNIHPSGLRLKTKLKYSHVDNDAKNCKHDRGTLHKLEKKMFTTIFRIQFYKNYFKSENVITELSSSCKL